MFLITQILLAIVFATAGMMKLLMFPKAATRMPVLQEYPKSFIRFVAISEIGAALGITFPLWLQIFPFFTPLAALGIMLLMVGAFFVVHVPRKEMREGMMNMVLFALALFVFIQTSSLLF